MRVRFEHVCGMAGFEAVSVTDGTPNISIQRITSTLCRNGLGEYFVYDLGGRLDWNHPTRAGHRRIAEYILDSGILGSADRANLDSATE